MRVVVCNREQAKSDLSEVISARHIISIITPGSTKIRPPGEWDSRLDLMFHDVLPEDVESGEKTSKGQDFVLFNEEMAEQILWFLDSVGSEREILVHCDAGISRSMAVGRFIKAFTGRQLVILTPGMIDDRFANIHVWNTLRRQTYDAPDVNF